MKPRQFWAIRFWLDHERRLRDRALFDRAIDSKLRGVDVVKVRIGDIVSGGGIRTRAIVVPQKHVLSRLRCGSCTGSFTSIVAVTNPASGAPGRGDAPDGPRIVLAGDVG